MRIFSNTVSCRIINDNHSLARPDIKMIDCTTIDDLLTEIKPIHLDIIKMDIEGAEIEALQGALYTIEKYSPHFVVASYHKRNNEKTYYWVEDFLKKKATRLLPFTRLT